MKKATALLLGILFCFNTRIQSQENEVMLKNAIDFLDIPYVAHTLEGNNEEELVVNCDEVDCITFVEYTLAISLSPTEDGQVSEGNFVQNLLKIRYRDGKINGYTSRLHYIADWVNNGIHTGFLEDIAATYSPYTQEVDLFYMSTNPEKYKHLANSPENVAKMKTYEQDLSGQSFHYVPQDKLPYTGLPWIKSGDIIAITTNTPGLDVAHMGIAFYVKDKLCLLHASSKEKKVVISKVALAQMLQSNQNWTGVRVLRMKK